MKTVKYICLIIITCIASLVNTYVINESINLLPLSNNLLHVKLKLVINGKDYKKDFFPPNILKILNDVNSLKFNIKRGVYRNFYNNSYLDNYPYGFSLIVDLKEEREDNTDDDHSNSNSKSKENDEFSKKEIFRLKQVFNELWSITGVSTNLFETKNLIKINNKIFAFLPEESLCIESFSLIKKLYPCKNFGGLFNAINPKYILSQYSSNIGLELNDNNEKQLLVLYVDYITQHNHKKNIKVIDLINSEYTLNECPLIDNSSIIVKRKSENLISTIAEIPGISNWTYKDINLYNILQDAAEKLISNNEEEYINVNIIKKEANSMIADVLRKRQSSLVYIFQNLNKNQNSDFVFIDKLPYYLSPLLHTLIIQGKGPTNSTSSINTTNNISFNKLKTNCDFIYFAYHAIKKFNIQINNFDTPEDKITKHRDFYFINFKYNLPPKCEIIIRYEVIKIQIRSFEFKFDFERGILLESGIFKQKRNYILNEMDDLYKYTPPMLIEMSLPDSSMPFNVIAISLCVVTLFFGFIFKRTAKEMARYI
ncbi:GPI transamidase component GPI16, putative [Hepatocystis sp. ex Piliocolobus tephrosceles]|nr:GPI transamidase component GPI16, putative [Hepatocystis sp. ex Piliocolobus tephrosceles]